jgi:DNA polymerase (family 10)
MKGLPRAPLPPQRGGPHSTKRGAKGHRRSADREEVSSERLDLERELTVAEILGLDREYRDRASAGSLKKIAPKKNNPTREAWLPVMERAFGNGKATVLFSNTDRAHQLGRVKDWVVVYYRPPGSEREQRWTVVTEFKGRLKGRRVVRGRQRECLAYYGEEPVDEHDQ